MLRRQKVRRNLVAQRSETNYLAANNKGSKGPPKTNGEKRADQIANGVQAMKIDDTPRATSKNLEVLMEYEKLEKLNEANFVVIGMCGLCPWGFGINTLRSC